MKKMFVLLLSLILVSPAAFADTLIDWSQFTDDEIDIIIDEAYEELDRRMDGNYGASLIEDQYKASSLEQGLINLLSENTRITGNTSIDSVTINANYGTAKSGDCIALVYLTYTSDYGARYDGSFLIDISDTVGEIVEENYPEINELTVFWELPTYDSTAKATFILKEGKMTFEDLLWPKVLSDAR